MSVCAPGYVCLQLCVRSCLGSRVGVRPRPCVSECQCALKPLRVLCVHVSVSTEYVCVYGRVAPLSVYS